MSLHSKSKKHKVLHIHCDECDRYYEVDLVSGIKAQSRIIDFSICDNCKNKRNEFLWKVNRYPQCPKCHVPQEKLKDGLCTLHYARRYRAAKLQKKRI